MVEFKCALKVIQRLAFVLLVFPSFLLQAEQPNNSTNSSYIDEVLLLVDELKLSDPVNFNLKMQELQNLKKQATSGQVDFIRYFEVYQWVAEGDLNHAQTAYETLFEEVEDALVKIRIKATLANIQAISRQYNEALINLDYAITGIENHPNKVIRSKVHFVTANVYHLLDIFDMSIKYADLVIRDELNQSYLCKANAIKLASKFKSNQQIDQNKVHQVIGLCRESNQIGYALILTLDWLQSEFDGFVQQKDLGNIKILRRLLEDHEEEINKTQSNNLIGIKDMLMAKMYSALGSVDAAEKYATMAIQGSLNNGNTFQVVDSLKVLNQLSVARDDYKQAYQYMSQINRVENEIFSEAKAKQMAFMSIKHDNLAKQLEIEQLNQSNQMLFLENQLVAESTKKQQLIMLLIATLLLFLVAWTYKIKKRHDYFKEVAEIDHLTQVFTRKAFEERMSQLIESASSRNEPLNLSIMDLDHFKRVNDEHGHLVGDWVLQQVILTCEKVADQDIMIARLGGEEFSIVSPGISHQQMLDLMEKMRSAIAAMDCSQSGAEFNITASFGVSNAEMSGYRTSMLLTHADLALFEAKNKGRNQIISYAALSTDKTSVKTS